MLWKNIQNSAWCTISTHTECQLLLFIITGAGCQLEEEILKVGFKENHVFIYITISCTKSSLSVQCYINNHSTALKFGCHRNTKRLVYKVFMDATHKVPVNPRVLSMSA